ncbi:MAG: hypothetical protein QM604_01165, partial [Microbacterium sp.]
MRIDEALLATRSTSEVATFYRRLGCRVHGEPDRVSVRIGTSRLTFVQEDFAGSLHLAFTIPTGAFGEARRWLTRQQPLLVADGRDEFEGPKGWDSRSLYFDGPDGQVLELIERRALPGRIARPFTAADLVCVSEIGVVVPDV